MSIDTDQRHRRTIRTSWARSRRATDATDRQASATAWLESSTGRTPTATLESTTIITVDWSRTTITKLKNLLPWWELWCVCERRLTACHSPRNLLADCSDRRDTLRSLSPHSVASIFVLFVFLFISFEIVLTTRKEYQWFFTVLFYAATKRFLDLNLIILDLWNNNKIESSR